MAQEIVVDYRAEIDKITRDLEKYVKSSEDLAKSQDKVQKELDQTTKSVDKLEKELRSAGTSTKAASDNIKNFSKNAGAAVNTLGSSIKSIGIGIAASIGAAFTVDAVIQFGKASINAFLEAQETTEKLRFTITQVGGESEAAFQRLIDQSEKLQDITIFSDDSIQQAQTALSTFGLTTKEIEELIPKLADFAAATRTDIVQAAQRVGAGLQGANRELKKYGIEVSETATTQENLNKILAGFSKFAGAAEDATGTLTGQLEQARNKADRLQESVGEKLAPTFVRARVAIFELAEQIVNFTIKTDESIVKLLKTLGLAPAEIVKTTNTFKDFSQAILEQVNAAKDLAEFDEIALKLRNDQTAAIAKQVGVIDKLQESKEQALNREVVNLEEVRALNQAINLQQGTNLQNEVTKLNIIEDILIKQRAALANVEIKDKELSDKRIAGSEEEIKKIQRLAAQYKDFFNLINNQDQQQLIELSVLAEVDIEAFKQKIAELASEQGKEITVPIKLEPRVDTATFQDGLDHIEEETKITTDQILSETQNLVSELQSLTSQYTNIRLDEIEREKNAQMESYDEQQRVIDENLQKRRISETEAARLTAQLLEKRTADQKRAAEKERALKRKQFDIDKAAALIQIIINTAQAVTAALTIAPPAGEILAALNAALGAAQGAVVASQPNPYKKGTKSARPGLALVDEEGRETIFRHSTGRLTTLERGDKVIPVRQSDRYAEALDSMFENRFSKDYVKVKDITPRLIEGRKLKEQTREKTFADNIKNSIYVNVAPTPGKKLEAVKLTNVDELAQALAPYLKRDIYGYR